MFDLMRFKHSIKALLRRITTNKLSRTCLLQLSRFGLLPKWFWRRLPVDLIFNVYLPDNAFFQYCSTPSDTIGRALFWKGLTSWEADTISIFNQLVKHADVVLDIGANTGIYTLLACTVNPACEVFSFEPVPKVYSCLINNIKANRIENRCHTMQAAVSNEVGVANFCELDGEVPTSSSLNVNGFRGYKGKVYKVKTITIDSIGLTKTKKYLVKIDVEGYEHFVLEGMRSFITNNQPAMIIECNFDGPYRIVEEILMDFGYSFFHITSDGLIHQKNIIPDPAGKFLNFLCLPGSKSLNASGDFKEAE